MIQGTILSIISAICYGTMAVQAKLAYTLGMDEWDILLCRFVFGTFLFGLFLLVKDGIKSFHISRHKLLAAAVIGMFVYVVQSLCFFRSLKYISASTTALIFYGYPAAVTIVSALLGKLKLSRLVVFSLLSITFGCTFVFFDAFSRGANSLGLVYAFGAMAIFTFYLLLVQWLLRGENPLSVSFFIILFTAVGFCLIAGPSRLFSLNMPQLALGMSVGLIPTAMAITLLFLAIERVGSAYASIFSSFEPLATLVMAHLILSEPVVIYQLVGAACILYGIMLPNAQVLKEKRRVLKIGEHSQT